MSYKNNHIILLNNNLENQDNNNLKLQNNINNKDLLIVSLLEYICNIYDCPNEIFQNICNYLEQNNIIENDIVYSLDSSYLRDIYMKMISKMVNNNNRIQNNCSFYNSRYKDDFIEIEKLGKGGFGSVFKSYNKLDQKLYAVKKIPIKNLKEEKSNFYLNEARFLSSLNHKNVVRYYTTWIEFYKEDNKIYPILYIQMELCSFSLNDYLENRNYSGYLKENKDPNIKSIFLQICKGIKYIHEQNIIHRDLNPKNIFLIYENNKFQIKIGDFGLSKLSENNENKYENIEPSLELTNYSYYPYSYHNVYYICEEDYTNNLYTEKSDIYSLGIIYLELLLPFSTLMERALAIQDVKNNNWDNFDSLNLKEINLIKNITKNNYKERLNIKQVISKIKEI